MLPPGLKRAAVGLARRHGTVRACLASNQDGDDGPEVLPARSSWVRGSADEQGGGCAPWSRRWGHAKSMGEMRITASLSYKRWTDAEDKRGD